MVVVLLTCLASVFASLGHGKIGSRVGYEQGIGEVGAKCCLGPGRPYKGKESKANPGDVDNVVRKGTFLTGTGLLEFGIIGSSQLFQLE